MTIIYAGIWAFGATFFYSFTFNADKKEAFLGALHGGISWIIYLICLHYGYEPAGFALGAFYAALFAEIFAYVFKKPATVFLLPSLLPLVPGAGMFMTMRELVLGHQENAAALAYKTLIATGAIALGVAIASSFARFISSALRHAKKTNIKNTTQKQTHSPKQ